MECSNHLVQPSARKPVAGGEIDDRSAVSWVVGGAVEQVVALLVEWHTH
jgi:hypothetical protein